METLLTQISILSLQHSPSRYLCPHDVRFRHIAFRLMTASHQAIVLSKYRTLLRLIGRLDPGQRSSAYVEAQTTVRSRRTVTNPEEQLKHLKELTSKIGYLRIITPKQPGEVEPGVFTVQDGRLVEGTGEAKGKRYELSFIKIFSSPYG